MNWKFTVPKQKVSIDIVAIAKAAGVSISTVSRSYNHPELVKPETRKRIERCVQKLGYVRNRAAQAMHGKRSGTIGLIVPTIDHAIFAELIQSFSDAVDRHGFTLLLASHGYDLDREYSVLRKLLEHRVDGVALIGLDHSEASYSLIEQQEIPALAIWNYAAQSRISCVGADNSAAGRMMCEHLLVLGHRDIAMLFPDTTGNDRALDRQSGAIGALASAGIELPSHWKIEVPYSIARAKAVVMPLLAGAERPTALLCGNDVIAQGAVYGAQALGLRIPEDIAIAGIGDFKGSDELEPSLTTIRLPAHSIGQIAGEALTDAIAADSPQMVRHMCDLRIMVRRTTDASRRVADQS